MKSEFVDIKTDLSECKKLVDKLGYDSKYIVIDMLKAVGQKAKSKSRSYYKKQNYEQRTGALYDSINWHYIASKSGIVIDAYAKSKSSGIRYGYVLASGHRLISKKKAAEYEVNSGGSKWEQSGNVIKFKRNYDFIDTPVNKYLESPKYKTDLDKALQKKIAKIEKKMGITKK